MNAALINEQAIMALDGAEKIVQQSRLDVVLYAALLPAIGAEMSSAKDRERMMKLLQNVRDKGFAVASSFEAHLLVQWNTI